MILLLSLVDIEIPHFSLSSLCRSRAMQNHACAYRSGGGSKGRPCQTADLRGAIISVWQEHSYGTLRREIGGPAAHRLARLRDFGQVNKVARASHVLKMDKGSQIVIFNGLVGRTAGELGRENWPGWSMRVEGGEPYKRVQVSRRRRQRVVWTIDCCRRAGAGDEG